MEEYSKEQLKELYEQLPDNLKKAVFSHSIGDRVKNICDQTGLENNYTEVLKQVGYVFLGILSPGEFRETLKNPSAFDKINNEIFFDLKNDLDPLYSIDLKKTEEPKENPIVNKNKNDKYLEPIE